MPDNHRITDVFIAHSTADAPLAKQIAELCQLNGLSTFVADPARESGPKWADVLWEALAESKAVIAILPPSGPTPSMGVEIGAAQAWNKPLFGVLTDPARTPEPIHFEGIQFYTPSRIEDAIRMIARTKEAFSDSDRRALAEIYATNPATVDELALDPVELQRLVKRFAKSTGKILSGDQLLAELLRLRKQGKLARGGGARRAKRPTGS